VSLRAAEASATQRHPNPAWHARPVGLTNRGAERLHCLPIPRPSRFSPGQSSFRGGDVGVEVARAGRTWRGAAGHAARSGHPAGPRDDASLRRTLPGWCLPSPRGRARGVQWSPDAGVPCTAPRTVNRCRRPLHEEDPSHAGERRPPPLGAGALPTRLPASPHGTASFIERSWTGAVRHSRVLTPARPRAEVQRGASRARCRAPPRSEGGHRRTLGGSGVRGSPRSIPSWPP